MSKRTMVFVILALIVAVFYVFEVFLAILHQSSVGPILVKSLIVVACAIYAFSKIRGRKRAQTRNE